MAKSKSKQNRRPRDKNINATHIMNHSRKVHDGVYEEDTILERIALGCTLLLLLPIIGITAMCWWLYDKITRK